MTTKPYDVVDSVLKLQEQLRQRVEAQRPAIEAAGRREARRQYIQDMAAALNTFTVEDTPEGERRARILVNAVNLLHELASEMR